MPHLPLNRRQLSLCLSLALFALLAGCAAPDTRPFAQRLPAEYSGTVPCAGCPDKRWQLQLFPEQYFLLRESAATGPDDPAAAVHRFGKWLLSTDGRTLLLQHAGSEPDRLTVESAERLIAAAGAEQRPLDRSRRLRPLAATLGLQGMYQPPGTASEVALFEECQTGQQFRIEPGPEAEQMAALFAQEQQLSAPVGDPQRLMMSVTATLELDRSAADEPGSLPGMRVERVERAWPDLKCEQRVANAPLVDTYWRLVEVDGYRLPEGEYRPPYLRFEEGGRLAGSTGCNRLGGNYLVDGATLALSNLAATRMSCRGTAVIEQMFTDLLRRVAGWKVLGRTLELYDASGALVGRFEARSDQ